MTKILIAEDEPDIRELVNFTLKFGGFDVVTAANGAEAVELAPKEMPDLIMMDVRMPRMTGYEACVELKKIDSVKDIPVIFLSAKGQEAEVKSGMEAGAIAYILKPFAPDELLFKLKEVLAKVEAEKKEGKPAAEAAKPAETKTDADKPAEEKSAAAVTVKTPAARPAEVKKAVEKKDSKPEAETNPEMAGLSKAAQAVLMARQAAEARDGDKKTDDAKKAESSMKKDDEKKDKDSKK